MNPILAMLRSGGGGAGGGGAGGGNRRHQQRSIARSSSSSPSTAARAKMSRSVSVLEEMSPRPTEQSPPVPAPIGGVDERLMEEKEKRRSASETNLLNKCEGQHGTHAANAAGLEDGFYKSFDELADDIDDLATGVLASSNPLEASVVLRAQPAVSSAASSEATSSDTGARCSFNSSDSGRISNDTYAETSNSSVASAASNSISSHCNRLCSNTSNCSGDDSGMSSSNGSGLDNGGNARPEAHRERSKEGDASLRKVTTANGEGTYTQIEDEEAR